MTADSSSLRALLASVVPSAAVPDLYVGRVRDDSRLVQPGDVFVAVSGAQTDGRLFLHDALARGARVIVADAQTQTRAPLEAATRVAGATYVPVANARVALGHMLARQHNVLHKLRLLGVTGTNGKTTLTYLLEAILKAAGRQPGILGTVAYRYADVCEPAPLTTPGATLLHGLFERMAAAGCSDVVLEASSHALAQDRLAACEFAVAGLTNVTQDHLDFHGTMDAYFDAKARLFAERLAAAGVGVVFMDRQDGQRMAPRIRGRVLKLATEAASPRLADVCVTARKLDGQGTVATFQTPNGAVEVQSRLVGDYNLSNLTLAVGMAVASEVPLSAIAQGIAQLDGVPGRLQVVPNDEGVLCVVDYAHTPDALERALAAMRPLTRGRLLVVFGCGGDRDTSKRALMGGIAAEGADVAVVTSDNPRTEDPAQILEMILQGVRRRDLPELRQLLPTTTRGFVAVLDRRRAILDTIAIARRGDTVVIAGKGHEDYQIIGSNKIHFDDREEAAAAFAQKHGEPEERDQ